MINTTILELIHKDIDGELKGDEKSRLILYLAEDEEANKFYLELHALAKSLDQIPQVEAPADLKSNIISQINPELYRKPAQKETKIFNIGNMFTQQRIRTILVYAAVLIIGFSISVLLIESPGPSDYDDFHKILGTMGMAEDAEVIGIQSMPVQFDELKGAVDLKEADSIVWVEFNITSKSEYHTQVFYEPDHLKFILFRPINPDKLILKHTDNHLDVITAQPFILSFIKNSKTTSHLRFSIHQNDQKSKNFEFYIAESAEHKVQ